MIAVRLKPGASLLAGIPHWEHDGDVIVPVVAVRPPYGRAEAERDGYIRPKGTTAAEWELIYLKTLRRSCLFRDASDEQWREYLREHERFGAWAELEEWAEPPEPARAALKEVPLDVAEWLIREGWAEPIEADLSELEAEVARWTDELVDE